MKVVYIPDVGETYGAATSFKELVTTIASQNNVEPIVLTSKKSTMYSEFQKAGIEVYSIGHKAFFVSKGSTKFRKIIKTLLIPFYFIDYKISNYIAIKKAEKYVNFSNVDLIHTNVNRNDIGAILSKKNNIPHIWHIREFGKEDYDCYSLRRKYIKFMNNNADRFIAISNAVANNWIKKGLDAKKIKVVYNGVDSERFKINSNKDNDKIRLIMSGAITPSKGQIQAIEALSYLSEERRKKIQFDIYGTSAKEYMIYLKNIIKQNNLEDVVNFKGYESNIEKKVPLYDIGLVCSKSEGFGRVTIEYMMSGVCVIASDTGANPELVENEKTGLIYEYNNTKQLAEKIEKLIDSKELMLKLKKRGYEVSTTRFTKENNAQKIYKEYLNVVGDKNAI